MTLSRRASRNGYILVGCIVAAFHLCVNAGESELITDPYRDAMSHNPEPACKAVPGYEGSLLCIDVDFDLDGIQDLLITNVYWVCDKSDKVWMVYLKKPGGYEHLTRSPIFYPGRVRASTSTDEGGPGLIVWGASGSGRGVISKIYWDGETIAFQHIRDTSIHNEEDLDIIRKLFEDPEPSVREVYIDSQSSEEKVLSESIGENPAAESQGEARQMAQTQAAPADSEGSQRSEENNAALTSERSDSDNGLDRFPAWFIGIPTVIGALVLFRFVWLRLLRNGRTS